MDDVKALIRMHLTAIALMLAIWTVLIGALGPTVLQRGGGGNP